MVLSARSRPAADAATWGALVLLLGWVYVPFLRRGGFVLDDWSVWYVGASSHDYLVAYRRWFPLFSIRPLAPVVLAFTGRTFGGHAWAYIAFHLGLLFIALAVASHGWRSIPIPARAVFLALAGLPAAASTAVLSPGMQVVASVSLLLWALGDLLLVGSDRDTGRWRRRSGYVLFLCAMLVYEIVLPLFVLTLARFALVERAGRRRVLGLAGGMGVVVGLIALYQKVLVPRFSVSYSRLSLLSAFDAFRAGVCWVLALIVQGPVLLWSSLGHVHRHGSVSLLDLAVLAALAGVLGAAIALRPPDEDRPALRWWVVAAALALPSSAVLYVGSGQFANANGYDNRGLTSAWILGSLLVAALAAWCPARRIAGLAVAAIVFLSAVTLSLERNQQIRACDLQHRLLADIRRLADELGDRGPRHAQLLALAPVHLADNFNDELVFRHPWEFTAAVALTSAGHFDGGLVLTTDNWGGAPALDGADITAGQTRLPAVGTWFYEWGGEQSGSRLGRVERLETAEHLLELGRTLPQLRAPVAPAQPYTPIVLVERIRHWLATHSPFTPAPIRARAGGAARSSRAGAT